MTRWALLWVLVSMPAWADVTPFMPGAAFQLPATTTAQSYAVDSKGLKQARIVNPTLCMLRLRGESDPNTQVTATSGLAIMPLTTEVLSQNQSAYLSVMLTPSQAYPNANCAGMVEVTYGGGG